MKKLLVISSRHIVGSDFFKIRKLFPDFELQLDDKLFADVYDVVVVAGRLLASQLENLETSDYEDYETYEQWLKTRVKPGGDFIIL